MDWYIEFDGEDDGPYTLEVIGDLINEGHVVGDTLVWCSGMHDWGPAEHVPALAPAFAAEPPPLPNKEERNFDAVADRDSQIEQPVPLSEAPVELSSNEAGSSSKGRLGRSVPLVGGVVLALLVNGVVRVGFQWLDDQTSQPILTVETLEEAYMASPGGPMFQPIRDMEPAAYSKLLNDMVERLNSLPEHVDPFDTGYELTSRLRRDYAKYALHAPESQIVEVIEIKRDSIQMVQRNYPERCAAFAIDGPIAFRDDLPADVVSYAVSESSAVLHAQFVGKRDGNPIDKASEQDWDNLAQEWPSSGPSEAIVMALDSPQPTDANVCPAALSMLDTMLSADGPHAVRVKATYFAELAGG